ncbi:Vacuolar cation-chloride cotransporter 1 [Elsinoe australis]|uniref:Vacuolar cation-chloride cotransporter 1 n=1 Tax=Elsinoe australis TaxID=40998 RepID=A0A2P7ZTR1_9PEZI|nr:Vacuolar cation-chloride cotransporter 1 [Elsinoe australis]
MSSNRPFLSNFLAAFRAHSTSLPKAGPSLSTNTSTAPNATVWTATSTPYTTTASQQTQQVHSSPRTIDPRKVVASTTGQQSTSPGPLQPTTFSPPLQHNVTPLTHGPRRPSSPGNVSEKSSTEQRRTPGTTYNASAAIGIPATSSSATSRRRGSDSSSEGGFRDVASSRGQEKWYIGGRTAGGEERYYKLSMVRRERSADRLSADRLSL